jgi:hypothetical protein
MLKAWYKYVHKLSTSYVQVWNLCAVSTVRLADQLFGHGLYVADHTAYAQLGRLFTQPKTRFFNLLDPILCSVSTVPITNTKLINKDLYS